MRSLGMRVATAAALASCATAGFAACSIYGADLLLPAPADGGPDASAAQPDAPATDGDSCGHARWPARPAADDPGAGPDVVAVAALATLDIGVEADGGAPPSGFDLDGVCTCPGPDSCTNSSSTKPHCDNAGGGDNAGGALLSALASFGAFSSLTFNEGLAQGRFGLLLQVRGWNGLPNDTSVTVSLFVSNGLSGVEDGGVGPVKGDGTDRWTVDPGTLLGGTALDGVDCDHDNARCAPLFYDNQAYVAGGRLVGSFDFPIALGLPTSGSITIDLRGSVVTAELATAGGGWSLRGGVLAGRWASAKLLASLASLPDPLTKGAYLCGDDGTYKGLKTQICARADIANDPKADGTGAACDALSIAIGFTAAPAHMAEVYEKPPAAAGCSDGGFPFQDRCP